jgi:methylase of polypeptide subunit release factors
MIDELTLVNFQTDYFMEIGPGSGIISLSLANPSSTVVCCDISYQASKQTKSNAEVNRFHNFLVVTSSLVRPFRKGSIPHVVIFNPPYLPQDSEIDPYSPKYELSQLVGGKLGFETVSELLDQISPDDTTLYTIISSLASNPIEFNEIHPKWSMKVLAAKNMGFETIWILKVSGA